MRNGSQFSYPFLFLVILLQLQFSPTSASRDLLLNAPASKDSLFLSQPSRDWGPGGKLAEAARRKHNAKAARLRSSSSSYSKQQSANHSQSQNESAVVIGSGSGSGSGLDDRIRAGMRLHLDQNGLASNPDQESVGDGAQDRKGKDEEAAGKSEDRLITSGQKDKADRDAIRIASNPNKEVNQEESSTNQDSQNVKQTEVNSDQPLKEDQNQDLQSDKPQNLKENEETNRITNQRPPAEIIQTQMSDDETWERSNLFLFSNNNGRTKGRSGRRYSTNKGGLINSLKKLSTTFDSDEDFDEILKFNKLKSNENGREVEKKNEIDKKELERLKGKNREEALKQAEEAARNAVEDEKIFRDREKDEQMPKLS